MTSPDSLRLRAWTSLEIGLDGILCGHIERCRWTLLKWKLLRVHCYIFQFIEFLFQNWNRFVFFRDPHFASRASRKTSQISKYKEIMKKWSGTCHVFRVDTNNGKNWKPLGETSGGIQVQVNQRGIKTLTDGVLINEVNLKNSRITLIDLSDTFVIRFDSSMYKCKVCAIKCIRKWRSFRLWVQKRRWSTSFSK